MVSAEDPADWELTQATLLGTQIPPCVAVHVHVPIYRRGAWHLHVPEAVRRSWRGVGRRPMAHGRGQHD